MSVAPLPFLDRPFDECWLTFINTQGRRNHVLPDPTRFLRTRPPSGTSTDISPSQDPSYPPTRPTYPNPERTLNPEHEVGPYNRYDIRTSIEEFMGVKSAPLSAYALNTSAGSSGASAFWRQNGGHARLTVAWSAERISEMPVLPHWELTDPMYVLVYKLIEPASPRYLPESDQYLYRVDGVYAYDMKAPPGPNYQYPIGVTRLFLDQPTQFLLTGTVNFSKDPLRFLCGQSPPEYGYGLTT